MTQFPSKLFLRALAPDEIKGLGSDRALYEVSAPFFFLSSILGQITVPSAFITDFASIPRPALWYMDDDDPGILFASVIHDWLYTNHGTLPGGLKYTRQQADQVLREGMKICGARADQLTAVYLAVRLGGDSHWN